MSLGMRNARCGASWPPPVSLAIAPVATADPVWPVAGAESAGATIDDLEAQGYDVRINWVSGVKLGAAVVVQGHRDPQPQPLPAQ